jgi:hypothetical protein
MKINTLLTTALVATGLVAQASAANVVYLTGSTAFRATAYNALITPGDVFDSGQPISVAEFGSSQSGANYMLFLGKINNVDTYIDCAWSGSEAGIASAADTPIENVDRNGVGIPLAGSPEVWLKADGSIPMGGTQPEASAPTTDQLENNGVASHGADLAQADTSQAVSWTVPVSGTKTDLKDYGTEAAVTFVWAKNVNTHPSNNWTHLSNISLPQANVLLAVGSQPAGFFTGNTNDDSQFVYLVGRNKGSGTRANELSDTGFGTYNAVEQYSIGYGVEEAAIPNDLVLTNEGDNGYESGGGVATALGIDGSCQQADPFNPGYNGWLAVGFLGISDALAHGLTTANWLTFDGVAFSDGAVEDGQYDMWGHEHLYGAHGISGYQDTVGSKLYNGIITSLGAAGSNPAAQDPGVLFTYMNCDKLSDTAFPTRTR